mgnify:CR=1 FL=1
MTGGYGKGKKIVSDQCRLLSTTQRAHSNRPGGFPFLASAWSVLRPYSIAPANGGFTAFRYAARAG